MARSGRYLLIAALGLCAFPVVAQVDPAFDRAGWEPLPDTLFLALKVDYDQAHRLQMIEVDYGTERTKVMEATIPQKQRDTQLRKLADARRKEIKGVMTPEQFNEWQKAVRGSRAP